MFSYDFPMFSYVFTGWQVATGWKATSWQVATGCGPPTHGNLSINPRREIRWTIMVLLVKTDGLGRAMDPPDPPDEPDPVSSTAARDTPAIRAGGQDDGRYTKLPQNIINRLLIFIASWFVWLAPHDHEKGPSPGTGPRPGDAVGPPRGGPSRGHEADDTTHEPVHTYNRLIIKWFENL